MKKIVCILVMTLLIATASNVFSAKFIQKNTLNVAETFEVPIKFIDCEDTDSCAGMVATGTCVKDGRSIFWKQRHKGNSTDNKPYFHPAGEDGPYKYFSMSDRYDSIRIGMSENGLAIGGFTAFGKMHSDFKQIHSDATQNHDVVSRYVLANCVTVAEAANYIAKHTLVWINESNVQRDRRGVNTGIISQEEGVGAIVSTCNLGGANTTAKIYSHITWVNDSWQPMDNALHCNHKLGEWAWDTDKTGFTINDTWNNITNFSSSSDGDDKITWEDVCKHGAKNVGNKEKHLFELFKTKLDISQPISVCALVAVSGDSRYDGALNMGFLQMGRQALVGTFTPLSAYFLNSDLDIPYPYRVDGGIEDYVDVKVDYATNGAGHGDNLYDPFKVREIQWYANPNERYMFEVYQGYYDSIQQGWPQYLIENMFKDYVNDMFWLVFDGYVTETRISVYEDIFPDAPVIKGGLDGIAGKKNIYQIECNNPENLTDNCQLFFEVCWGDSDLNNFYGPYPPDIPIPIGHTWEKPGKYEILVRAMNRLGLFSDWSEPIIVNIPRTKISERNCFYGLIEHIADMFPILQRLLDRFGL